MKPTCNTVAKHDPTAKVRAATLALKQTVRELIQDEPTPELDLFDQVFPGQAPLSVREARLSVFNGVVSWLMADLRAEKRKLLSL